MTNQPIIDAWKQQYELENKYTAIFTPKHNLKVTALGLERTIRLDIGDPLKPDDHGIRTWHSTQRNVNTMRKLAAAINEACDMVEAWNPQWASSAPQDNTPIPIPD